MTSTNGPEAPTAKVPPATKRKAPRRIGRNTAPAPTSADNAISTLVDTAPGDDDSPPPPALSQPSPAPVQTQSTPAAAPITAEALLLDEATAALPPAPARLLLTLPASSVPSLLRHRLLTMATRPKALPAEYLWLDSAEDALASQGVVLERVANGTEHLVSLAASPLAPFLQPPAVAEEQPQPDNALPGEQAGAPTAAEPATMPPLQPYAGFSGTQRRFILSSHEDVVEALLVQGQLRCAAAEAPAARLELVGPLAHIVALGAALAESVPLQPGVPLAQEARALARGDNPAPRRGSAPLLVEAPDVESAFCGALEQLLQSLSAQAPRCREDAGPEGVHQARVALRRLRAMLKLFQPATGCPALAVLHEGLRGLAQQLGAARDLDVFLGGIGAEVATHSPGEPRLAGLLEAAKHARSEAYGILAHTLEGQAFRTVLWQGLTVLATRPWRIDADEERLALLAMPPRTYAAPLLQRRWRKLRRQGKGLRHMPAEALHALRLRGKQVRYAAELFAPLWPGKSSGKFLRHLANVQEALGLANDAAVAQALAQNLAGNSLRLSWAAGLISGYALCKAGSTRKKARQSWKALVGETPFWEAA